MVKNYVVMIHTIAGILVFLTGLMQFFMKKR